MAAVIALPLVGCAATIQSGGFTVDKAFTERAFDEIRSRAAFEFGCPREQITPVVLNVRNEDSSLPTQIGVSACGRRAVYVPTLSGWVMNTETTRAQASP